MPLAAVAVVVLVAVAVAHVREGELAHGVHLHEGKVERVAALKAGVVQVAEVVQPPGLPNQDQVGVAVTKMRAKRHALR